LASAQRSATTTKPTVVRRLVASAPGVVLAFAAGESVEELRKHDGDPDGRADALGGLRQPAARPRLLRVDLGEGQRWD
jgi:hypothetical protein